MAVNNVLRLFGTTAILVSVVTSSHLVSRDISTPGLFDSIPPSTTLVWHPCIPDFFCALLDVPLDYSLPNGARAFVPLLKFPATTTPYKGMVLTNPGGPGDSAIDFLLQVAPLLAGATGTNYDTVAWEPRGIGYSTPIANCSTITPQMQLSKRLLNKPYGPALTDKFFNDEYSFMQDLGAACHAQIGGAIQIGQHMNTAVVSRDVLKILDAYTASSYSAGASNSTLFNFWGFSYGTQIGQTFASMFPQRVGRMVLDGVLDPEDYRESKGLKNLQLTDIAFSTFFIYCNKAGAENCPYYTGSKPRDIFNRFERTVLRLDSKRAFEKNWANATAIHLGLLALKKVAVGTTTAPIALFPQLAQALLFFEQAVQDISVEDVEQLEAMVGSQLNLHPAGSQPAWPPAIACSDTGNKLLGKTVAQLKPVTLQLQAQSYIAGEIWASNRIACSGWSIPGKGRFTGPFGGDTKTPILFVSNTRDPITPIFNGIKALGRFKRSQLLTIDGTGHLSLTTENTCAFAKINAYFQSGTLPGLNFFCPLEAGPWGLTINSISLKRGVKGLVDDIVEGLKGLWD